MRFFMLATIMVFFILLFGCAQNSAANVKEAIDMKLTSVFKQGEPIPALYTCDGKDTSPPLKISDVPKDAKSLALIVDDPDAPAGTWVHWVVYDIPQETREIPEGAKIGLEGMTDFGKLGYGGPCPPDGWHTYRFKLYALDKMLDLKEGETNAQLEKAMEGHVIAQAELDGEYIRIRT